MMKAGRAVNAPAVADPDRRTDVGERTLSELVDQFWATVTKGTADDCWPWRGALNFHGYGHVRWLGGVVLRCHRVAWELVNGAVPPGLWVLHRCDFPACVNPSHLFLGTPKDNTQDMMRKNRDGHGALPGESNPFAKLTDADVVAIRLARKAGVASKALEARYSVSRSCIHRIVSRAGWRHVP